MYETFKSAWDFLVVIGAIVLVMAAGLIFFDWVERKARGRVK